MQACYCSLSALSLLASASSTRLFRERMKVVIRHNRAISDKQYRWIGEGRRDNHSQKEYSTLAENVYSVRIVERLLWLREEMLALDGVRRGVLADCLSLQVPAYKCKMP